MSPSQPIEESLALLQKHIRALGDIPNITKAGFMNIADHMGDFSASFASGASRAITIRERIGVNDSELGLTDLRHNLRQIYREITGVFQSIKSLVKDKEAFSSSMEQIADWGLRLEQDAHLPLMVDQVRGQGKEELERQTLAAIIDSLMRQMRPLVHEVSSCTQEASDIMNHLTRRIIADLDTSNHSLTVLKGHTASTLKRMSSGVQNLLKNCTLVESQSDSVNEIIFEMIQAMQYDDISSQRISHVITALERAIEKLQSLGTAEDPQTNLRWFILVIRICGEQLRGINTDLVAAVNDMHHHLTRISDVAEGQKKSVSAAQGLSMELRKDCAEISYHLHILLRLGVFDENLSSDVLKTLSKAENAVFQAKRALDVLSMTCERLEHLVMGLDTSRNGRLENLARSVSAIAMIVKQEGKERHTQLMQAVDKLQAITMFFSEKTTPKVMRTHSLLRRLPMLLQQIESTNNDIRAMMNENLSGSRTVGIQIMLLSAEMDFHTKIEGEINQIMEQLTTTTEKVATGSLATELGGDLHEMAREFEDLASMYTMDSERRAHGDALGEDTDLFGEPSSSDDEIELF
ncbi:MAG: hypothetical protein HQL07_00815 [Nitrospirae bacterium]|nr:hypothetical protein [Magnetococcales bacterium]HAT48780.1 hypothetical protein [Alphaproteobacteria bacterium]